MRYLLIIGLFGSVVPGMISGAAALAEQYSDAERNHWSFRKRTMPEIPGFTDPTAHAWVRNPVDAFILAKLTQAELRPAPEADRRTLIRRLSFDLTGLPPSAAEVREFIDDPSPDAYDKLVDRLLASPHHGERWGQHWLDVVRYGETEGFEYDRHRPDAWRYRDYVIRSLNADKPFDQLIREQVAGDELGPPVENADPMALEAWIAAGFHRLGPVRRNAGNPDVAFSRNEVLTEMTDIIGAAFLGLSLGCARCHDHMFDPIQQKDYYRMQAFLAATQEFDVTLAPPDVQAAWKRQSDAVNKEINRIKKALEDSEGEARQQLEAKLEAAEERLPPPLPAISTVTNDFDKLTPIHVLKRGDESNKGEQVGMRALGVLLPNKAPELAPATKGPKMILAQWLTDPGHPLVARVLVNRLWLSHFGQGIVSTPNDFGFNGSPPSHPELLDFLAESLVENGWRLKSIHRLIVSSNTYRQASRFPDPSAALAKDPGNRLLWRFNRRRLDAEQVRDTLLAVSGKLNPQAGGPSVIVPVERELVNLLYKPSQWAVTRNEAEHYRRSIYLIAKRNLRLPFLDVFDQPDLQTTCSRRQSSTHAPQALELLNGKLANQLAEAFADRLLREAAQGPGEQVELAFRLTTGRPPSSTEQRLALRFLETQPVREFALAMFNLNDLLYID